MFIASFNVLADEAFPQSVLKEEIGVSSFEKTNEIMVVVDNVKVINSKTVECNNAFSISLKALAHFKNVSNIYAFLETNKKTYRGIFGLSNLGGLVKNKGYISASLSLPEVNGRNGKIWILMKTDKNTYGRVVSLKCDLIVQ